MGKKKQRALEREMMGATKEQMARYLEEQKIQRGILDEQKRKYREFTFENPFADVENFYEDLEVGTEAAEFQMEQAAQQRANIMQGLRGAAGSSGIAGLAQALANQGQLQARQVSIDISEQERQNTLLQAQGAAQADMLQRQGAAAVQSAEFGREATLLAAEYNMMAGANEGVQAAYANQMAAFGARAQMNAARSQMWGSILGGVAGGFMMGGMANLGAGKTFLGKTPSDRRLKKNINKIGESLSGLNIYSFEYKDLKHGQGLFQGVMSDEVPQKAVVVVGGYDHVDYSMLDVEFKQI